MLDRYPSMDVVKGRSVMIEWNDGGMEGWCSLLGSSRVRMREFARMRRTATRAAVARMALGNVNL